MNERVDVLIPAAWVWDRFMLRYVLHVPCANARGEIELVATQVFANKREDCYGV